MLFPAVQPRQTAERAHFGSFLTATSSSPHHRPLTETWQTELERDAGRRGLGLKVRPKFSFLLRFIHCILETSPPHPDSTNKPHWARSCYLLLYNPTKQQKRALFGSFLLFGSSQTLPKQQHNPCWLVLLVGGCQTPTKKQKCINVGTFLLFVGPGFLPNSGTYQKGYVLLFFPLPVHPKQQNEPLLARFAACRLSVQQKHTCVSMLLLFASRQDYLSSKTSLLGLFCCFAGLNCLAANSLLNEVCFFYDKIFSVLIDSNRKRSFPVSS